MTERSNEEWLAVLRQPGPARDAALEDLRARLVRGLGYALSSRGNVREMDLEDFAQDALIKILDALDTFRGESRFTTWAQKIAVRTAFSELRRLRWRDVSLDEMTEGVDGSVFVPLELVDPGADTERQTVQRLMIEAVRRVIDEELTDRQRQALVAAVIHGMPPDEIARRMGSNRNAVYKLIHDARQRMKQRILAANLSPQAVFDAFER